MTRDSFALFLAVGVGIVWLAGHNPIALGQDEVVYGEKEALDSEVDEDGRVVSRPDMPTQVEKEHRIVSGDTLWDLCAVYLNNPWYWPRVWSYNPDLTNPHWIYPGQTVKFFPTGELPSEMLVSNEIEIPETVPDLYEENPPEEMVKFAEGKDIVRAKTVTSVDLNRDTFITQQEIEGVGTIKGSREEKENLSQYDSIYIEYNGTNQVQIGQKYLIVRTIKEINHPISGDFVGYHVQIQGIANVLKVEGKIATGIIILSYNPIYRGDKVIPWKEKLNKQIDIKPNTANVRGNIVDSKYSLTSYGERNLVFIDRGTSHGVQEGNVFDCVRKQEGMIKLGDNFDPTAWDDELPMEIYGRIMVVDARETASTALVVSSIKELCPGDRIVMTVQ